MELPPEAGRGLLTRVSFTVGGSVTGEGERRGLTPSKHMPTPLPAPPREGGGGTRFVKGYQLRSDCCGVVAVAMRDG